jgi:hypothetical protein
LQLLKEVAPNVSRVAVLWEPAIPWHRALLKQIEAAAPLPVLRDHTHYPVRLHGIGARAGLRKVGKDTTWLDGYVRHSNRHTFASRTLTSHLTTCTVAVERLVKPGPADPVCEHVSAGELARN